MMTGGIEKEEGSVRDGWRVNESKGRNMKLKSVRG